MGFLTNLCCRESPAVVDTTCAGLFVRFEIARDQKKVPLLPFAPVSGPFLFALALADHCVRLALIYTEF